MAVSFATHTCWIGNISSSQPEEALKSILDNEAKSIGQYHSLHLNLSRQHNSYQCYINYFKIEDALNAEKYFNNKEFYGQNLQAKYRPPKVSSHPGGGSGAGSHQNNSSNMFGRYGNPNYNAGFPTSGYNPSYNQPAAAYNPGFNQQSFNQGFNQ